MPTTSFKTPAALCGSCQDGLSPREAELLKGSNVPDLLPPPTLTPSEEHTVISSILQMGKQKLSSVQ